MRKFPTIGLMAAALIIAAGPVATARAETSTTDGVIMHGGHVMTMERGKPMAPISEPMTMSNGSKVMPGGMVKMKNGHEMHLKNGEMMMKDGYVMKGGKAKPMAK